MNREDEGEASRLPKEWMDKQIAKSVFRNTSSALKRLVYNCVDSAPVQVRRISFGAQNLRLSIAWPLTLPEPIGDSGEWLGTKKELLRVRRELADYLSQERIGRELAKLLHHEFCKFLLGHLKAYRFTPDRLNADVVPRLERLCGKFTRRRFAGRHEPRVPPKKARQVRLEAQIVLKIITQIRARIPILRNELESSYKPADRVGIEKAIIGRLCDEYDVDYYPWMKYFRHALRRLPAKAHWKGSEKGISYPKSWSPTDLAWLIICESLHHETGVQYPKTEIVSLLKPVTHPARRRARD